MDTPEPTELQLSLISFLVAEHCVLIALARRFGIEMSEVEAVLRAYDVPLQSRVMEMARERLQNIIDASKIVSTH